MSDIPFNDLFGEAMVPGRVVQGHMRKSRTGIALMWRTVYRVLLISFRRNLPILTTHFCYFPVSLWFNCLIHEHGRFRRESTLSLVTCEELLLRDERRRASGTGPGAIIKDLLRDFVGSDPSSDLL